VRSEMGRPLCCYNTSGCITFSNDAERLNPKAILG
jgi:hypothetical protein